MSLTSPVIQSRLPKVGTTIFTVMSALAAEKGAVNLGQGFPDFGCDRALTGAVTEAMNADLNQYPPMAGVPQLRQAISAKVKALYGRHKLRIVIGRVIEMPRAFGVFCTIDY